METIEKVNKTSIRKNWSSNDLVEGLKYEYYIKLIRKRVKFI